MYIKKFNNWTTDLFFYFPPKTVSIFPKPIIKQSLILMKLINETKLRSVIKKYIFKNDKLMVTWTTNESNTWSSTLWFKLKFLISLNNDLSIENQNLTEQTLSKLTIKMHRG